MLHRPVETATRSGSFRIHRYDRIRVFVKSAEIHLVIGQINKSFTQANLPTLD